jgi:hypothetical protein
MTATIVQFRPPPPESWRSFCRWCLMHPGRLKTVKEYAFIESMTTWPGRPTEKQLWWLDLIRSRYEGPLADDPPSVA